MTPTPTTASRPRCPASWSHSGRRASWKLSCSLPAGHDEPRHYDGDARREWAD